jgi:hypothetical protein
MNRNLKKSVWVLALGIAFTGLGTTGITAAVPPQQGQDHDRNDHQNGNRGSFQQGLRDGQHDRQFGGNRDDHQQPNDANDLQAYQDGYRQGFRNTAPNPNYEENNRGRNVSYFEQGLWDGQHDRQYGGSRSDHQQPGGGRDLSAYRKGYKQGFRNNASNQDTYRGRGVNYFDQGLKDGQHDRQFGGNRDDHRQPDDANGLRAYQDGYRKGFRNN